MKNSNITFASLIILGLFLSLTIGCQAEIDEVVDLTIEEENLTAKFRGGEYNIDMNTQKGHGFAVVPEACVGCHQGSNRTVLQFDPPTNETVLTPHNIMIDFYEGYVSNHTQESAAMNGINLESVIEYIETNK